MKKELKEILKHSSNPEKYESGLKLMKLFHEERNFLKFEYYGNLTISIDPTRPEAIYILVKHFREFGEHFKALHYYHKIDDVLFTPENQKFKTLLEYNYTISVYYVDSDKNKGLIKSIEYLNTPDRPQFENVFNNLEYYIQPIQKLKEPYNYNWKNFEVKVRDKDIVYNPSSPSLAYVEVDGEMKTLLNVRYKQYKISPQGAYYTDEIENGKWIVRTENFYCFLDEEFKPTSELKIMPTVLEDLPIVNVDIKGLEDLRIFNWKGKIYHISTTREYSSYNDLSQGTPGCYRMVMGEYDWKNQRFLNNKVLEPPHKTDCEKNWIPIIKDKEELFFIYSYHPLKIGKLNEDNKLEIIYEINTPAIFSKFRGSSVSCHLYQDRYYILTHLVKYTNPRKYYHSLIVLDQNFNLIRYTLPFVFCSMSIEYCLGMNVSDGHATFIISQWDDKPTLIQNKISDFHWIESG